MIAAARVISYASAGRSLTPSEDRSKGPLFYVD
jgi:hypothetical protein